MMNIAQACGGWLRHEQPLQSFRTFSMAVLARQYGWMVVIGTLLSGIHLPAKTAGMTISDYRTYLPDSHPVPMALEELGRAVNQSKVLTQPVSVIRNPLQANPRQQIQALQDGALQAPTLMLAAASGIAELLPSFAWFDAPYALPNAAQAENFYSSPAAQQLMDQLHRVNLHGLAWMENGWRVITATTALKNQQDFEGVRIRTVPIALSQQTFQLLGANPISLPAHQVQTALRAGQLSAQESFITQLLLQPPLPYQTHLWLTQHSYGAQVLLMNLGQWKKLTAAQQKQLQLSAYSIAAAQRQQMRKFDQDAIATLAAYGMRVHTPSAELMQALTEATKHLRAPRQAP